MISKETKKLFESVVNEMDVWSEHCGFDEIVFSVYMLSIFLSHRIVVRVYNHKTNTGTEFSVEKNDAFYINNLFAEAIRQVKE